MLKGLFMLHPLAFPRIYGGDERAEIEGKLDMVGPFIPIENWEEDWKPHADLLKDIEVIVSGWGAPHIDEAFLEAAPNLKIMFYGAGSVKGILSDAAWERGVRITSAYAANAIPVAEYSVSQIIFALKRGWQYQRMVKQTRDWTWDQEHVMPGAYKSTVGIISLGMIGRHVCKLLKNYDVNIIAYDPFVDEQQAAELGVELVSLDELFKRSDVVSLHAPWLKETENMITGELLSSLKVNAAFINTARGAIVNQPEMIDVLKKRPDLTAVLDVTWPEPPPAEDELFDLDNVVLTPHIAGSMHNECFRMAAYMSQEIDRYIAGEPLKWEITREQLASLA
jgi:phosphoglycerate dehydrogenase-like enzyme